MDALRINGAVHSWQSTRVLWMGVPVTGITSIEFSDKRERTFVHGLGRHGAPIGRTRGKYTVDPVKITMYSHTVRDVLASLIPLSPLSIGDAVFDIIVQLDEPDPAVRMSMTTLKDCCITSIGAAYSEGSEAMLQNLELSCMRIYRNKQTLFSPLP